MLGVRTKISFGFSGLLLIILVIGVQAILRVNELGQSIDVIIRENYRSVIAMQEIKECIERIDSGILFVLLGYEQEGKFQIDTHLAHFDKAMSVESGNVTLPGEGEAFKTLQVYYGRYRKILEKVGDVSQAVDRRKHLYFTQLQPLFQSVKQFADQILQMNQKNMTDANMIARTKAAEASQRMYLLLVCGIVIAGAFVIYTGRWILRPIKTLTTSANEIAHGNLDLVVGATSRDELGQLSRTFDIMASSLREYRRTNDARLLNTQRATQQALDALATPIIVFDRDLTVELATRGASEVFELEIGRRLLEGRYPWMSRLVEQVLKSGRRAVPANDESLVQRFVGNQEKFFRPEALPVLDGLGQTVGVTLLLHDITQMREQDELKRGLISTVSHQLKTPLTSIRMALYLLLGDKLGPLTPKQEELLVAARNDTDRLHAIVEDLLDIARIQSGRIQMDMQDADAVALAIKAIEPFQSQARDHGITLTMSLPADLPAVKADPTRIPHVFANLISNAIKYTAPGGQITVSAREECSVVWYAVSDTGSGIDPEYQSRVFEQFFRVPQEGKDSGAGLGLAIAKEIVEAHGGEIRVESQPDKGSTFSFSLINATKCDSNPKVKAS